MTISPLGGLAHQKGKRFFIAAFFLSVVICSGFFSVNLSCAYVPSDLDFAPIEEEKPQVGRLFIETEPSGATIKILNIKPSFYQGIELAPGKYHVAVLATGYQTHKKWISLSAGEDKSIVVRLAEADAQGASFTNAIGMKFVFIPPGAFMMGSPKSEKGRDDDETQHKVTLTKEFYLGVTEVTQGQWKVIMGNNPSHFHNRGDDCPVEKVSWDDCQKFIRKLNQKERTDKYRLPTEAEWEYACRAGTDIPFFFGKCLSTEQANYNGNYPYEGCANGKYRGRTLPVGSFPPNAWGLCDMHGNVWEWCQDWKGYYPLGAVTDPQGLSSGSRRVRRGGSWNLNAWGCRSANRGGNWSDNRDSFLGFRLAKIL